MQRNMTHVLRNEVQCKVRPFTDSSQCNMHRKRRYLCLFRNFDEKCVSLLDFCALHTPGVHKKGGPQRTAFFVIGLHATGEKTCFTPLFR